MGRSWEGRTACVNRLHFHLASYIVSQLEEPGTHLAILVKFTEANAQFTSLSA